MLHTWEVVHFVHYYFFPEKKNFLATCLIIHVSQRISCMQSCSTFLHFSISIGKINTETFLRLSRRQWHLTLCFTSVGFNFCNFCNLCQHLYILKQESISTFSTKKNWILKYLIIFFYFVSSEFRGEVLAMPVAEHKINNLWSTIVTCWNSSSGMYEENQKDLISQKELLWRWCDVFCMPHPSTICSAVRIIFFLCSLESLFVQVPVCVHYLV